MLASTPWRRPWCCSSTRWERRVWSGEADATDPQCRQDRCHGKCVSDNRQAYETQGVGNTPDDDCFCLTDPLHDAASKEGLHENLYDPETDREIPTSTGLQSRRCSVNSTQVAPGACPMN